MARRSSTKPASSSKSGKKRASPQAMVTPTRASKRLKTIEDARATSGSRSKVNYNEAGSGEESISEEEYKAEADEATAASSSDEDEDDDEESFSEEDTGRSSKRGSRKRAGRVHKKTRKEDPRISSGTGLGPGKQVVVKLPKPRSAGATPYEPHTIHPNTFLFLKDLAQNNSREWLKGGAPLTLSSSSFDCFTMSVGQSCSRNRQLTIPISAHRRRTLIPSSPFYRRRLWSWMRRSRNCPPKTLYVLAFEHWIKWFLTVLAYGRNSASIEIFDSLLILHRTRYVTAHGSVSARTYGLTYVSSWQPYFSAAW